MPCSSTRHSQAGLMILMSLFSILAPWNPGTYQTKLKWALETWATKSLAEKTQRATARAAGRFWISQLVGGILKS